MSSRSRPVRAATRARRVLPVVILVIGSAFLTCCSGAAEPGPRAGTHRSAQAVAVPHGRLVRALAVLHAWDTARAAAYAGADARRLRRLYGRGTTAGAADARLLRRYAGRGLVVDGMHRQVLEADVGRGTGRRFVLRVTDRLAGAVAVGPGGRRPLPAAGVHRWRLVFRRAGGRWLVVGVRRR